MIRLARLRVVKNRVPMAESAAPAVLPGQTHRNSLQQQRSKGQRFGNPQS